MVTRKDIINWCLAGGLKNSDFYIPFKDKVDFEVKCPKGINEASTKNVSFTTNDKNLGSAGVIFTEARCASAYSMQIRQIQIRVDNPKLWFVKCCLALFPPEGSMRISFWKDCCVFGCVSIDTQCFIGFGSVIGGIGFGYVADDVGILHQFPHYGRVIIEYDVEIGSNCTIDRGSLSDTVIGEGSKIDSNVFIAHNVKIGKHCLIVAGSVICGSAEIGDGTFVGANATIKNGVKVGANCIIGMGACVIRDVKDGQTVAGNPARLINRNSAR